MSIQSKLKSNAWEIVISIAACVVVVLGPLVFFDEGVFRIVISVVAGLMVVIHLAVLFRTRNPGHLAALLFYVFLGLTFQDYSEPKLRLLAAIIAGGFYILFSYVLVSKKINWRYREILELAAGPVEKTDDGFTDRPYPAGKVGCKKEQITAFGKFLLRHVIAMPYYEDNRVVFVIPKNMFLHLLYLRRNYLDDTYVAEKDYDHYKKRLTFDQLCKSLADVFKEFFELYQAGDVSEVIKRLNSVKTE